MAAAVGAAAVGAVLALELVVQQVVPVRTRVLEIEKVGECDQLQLVGVHLLVLERGAGVSVDGGPARVNHDKRHI